MSMPESELNEVKEDIVERLTATSDRFIDTLDYLQDCRTWKKRSFDQRMLPPGLPRGALSNNTMPNGAPMPSSMFPGMPTTSPTTSIMLPSMLAGMAQGIPGMGAIGQGIPTPGGMLPLEDPNSLGPEDFEIDKDTGEWMPMFCLNCDDVEDENGNPTIPPTQSMFPQVSSSSMQSLPPIHTGASSGIMPSPGVPLSVVPTDMPSGTVKSVMPTGATTSGVSASSSSRGPPQTPEMGDPQTYEQLGDSQTHQAQNAGEDSKIQAVGNSRIHPKSKYTDPGMGLKLPKDMLRDIMLRQEAAMPLVPPPEPEKILKPSERILVSLFDSLEPQDLWRKDMSGFHNVIGDCLNFLDHPDDHEKVTVIDSNYVDIRYYESCRVPIPVFPFTTPPVQMKENLQQMTYYPSLGKNVDGIWKKLRNTDLLFRLMRQFIEAVNLCCRDDYFRENFPKRLFEGVYKMETILDFVERRVAEEIPLQKALEAVKSKFAFSTQAMELAKQAIFSGSEMDSAFEREALMSIVLLQKEKKESFDHERGTKRIRLDASGGYADGNIEKDMMNQLPDRSSLNLKNINLRNLSNGGKTQYVATIPYDFNT